MNVCDVYGFNKGLECVFKQFPKQAECSNYQDPSVIIIIAVLSPHPRLPPTVSPGEDHTFTSAVAFLVLFMSLVTVFFTLFCLYLPILIPIVVKYIDRKTTTGKKYEVLLVESQLRGTKQGSKAAGSEF